MSHGAPSIWTPELIAELTRLWDVEKWPAAAIGRKLNVSKSAVVGKADRLGLSSRPSPIKNRRPKQPPRAPDGCRFPLWSHTAAHSDGRFCCALVLVRNINGEEVRSSYCQTHWRLCTIQAKHPIALVTR